MKTSSKILWFATGALFAAVLAVILFVRISISHSINYPSYHGVRWSLGDNRVVGNGNVVSRSVPLRAVDNNFNGVDFSLSSDIQVDLSQQKESAAATAVIIGDSNLLPYINVYVHDGVLYFTTRNNVDLVPSRDIKITVNAVQKLRSLVAHGSGDFHINNVNSDDFTLEVRGSGGFNLQGMAKKFAVGLYGSGNVNAKNLIADDVKVDIHGSGDALVYARNAVSIDIAGSGSVKYYGSPQQVTQNVHGSGDIIKM